MRTPILSNALIETGGSRVFLLSGSAGYWRAWLEITSEECEGDNLEEKVLPCLGLREREYLQQVSSRRRRQTFLLGRLAAWRACRGIAGEEFRELSITPGALGKPVLSGVRGCGLSLAHSQGLAAAIVFPLGCELAVDLESLERPRLKAVDRVLSDEETKWARAPEGREGIGSNASATKETRRRLLALWCAREAAGKVLGCGLQCGREVLETASHHLGTVEEGASGWCVSGAYRILPAWDFRAEALGNTVLAVAKPANLALAIAEGS
jgi:phosphopantetheinyl transferase